MLRGLVPFAPAMVERAKFMLEHRRRALEGLRGRLIRCQGRIVFPVECQQIADGLMQRGDIGMTQHERGAEMGERLDIRVQGARVLACQFKVFRRLRRASRLLEMRGHLTGDLADLAARARNERLRHATVQQSPPRLARLVVRERA